MSENHELSDSPVSGAADTPRHTRARRWGLITNMYSRAGCLGTGETG